MQKDIQGEITSMFDKNFERLNNLLSLYKSLSNNKGRKTTNTTDLLRATVVLMHSTLEDFLRNILLWKLPYTSKEKINEVPLLGTSESGRRTKFELGELLLHKNKTIEEVIYLSVKEYLNTISFNDTNDIAKHLINIGITITEDMNKIYFPQLKEMIKRRHNIVHQADRESKQGVGHHKIKYLSYKQVQDWKDIVDRFVQEVLKLL